MAGIIFTDEFYTYRKSQHGAARQGRLRVNPNPDCIHYGRMMRDDSDAFFDSNEGTRRELSEFTVGVAHVYYFSVNLGGAQSFPQCLTILSCVSCNLDGLPDELPASLEELNISMNPKVKRLPALPATLREFICANCNIEELLDLPDSLVTVGAENNRIRRINHIPPGILLLDLDKNRLRSLPALPGDIRELFVDNNFLTDFPGPLGSVQLSILDNPISSGVPVPDDDNRGATVQMSLLNFNIDQEMWKYGYLPVEELREFYLVTMKLIRRLEVDLRLPVDLVRLLFTAFLVKNDVARLTRGRTWFLY